MSQRTTRVNQLLLRELSEELHTRWRSEAVRITFTSVEISDDLRNAIVRYAVLGDAEVTKKAGQFLRRIQKVLKAEVFRRVKIKYTPELRFIHDPSAERGAHLLGIMDTVAREDARRSAQTEIETLRV
ncbi:MAG: ribosome-binding factor A [Puniceicoccales bacterium]|jgi:ribosome-binding factor A|nr:ribosome-binding factor A [Puniceicoccales bacterium]